MNPIFRWAFARSLSRVCGVGMTVSVIALSNVNAQTATAPSSTEKAAVDALIPWLLQEDAQLRGIPFSEVIFDSTGTHVLACNPKDETNARVLKQMSSVLDEVMARLNAPESPIQGIPRINEVSSHFEDLIRELLNKTPGLACDFPKTAAGGKQRSGYPDLELVDQLSHRIYYLDPKLYAVGSRDSSFRTFYFEPKVETNKVRDDAAHLILGFEHKERNAGYWKFTRWDIVDLAQFKVTLKAEVQGRNREMYRTDFTVSVDAARGVTTGISAHDRAATITTIADPKSQPFDLVQPGHIFPLRAKDGGVLRRAGHTEAAVDLARMAGLQPAGVLCEILHDDGTMARLSELMEFRKKHGLRICTIQSLIAFRRLREKLVELEQIVKLPTDYGDFDLHLYRSKLDGQHRLALVKGKIDVQNPTLVRVHSQCLTGDVFASRRCDCGNQLHAAMRQIEEEGQGVLVYMRQEGRGIGLAAKIHAYKLQEEGLDTVEANAKLGFPSDLRDYGLGAQILFDLGVRQFRFLTNNPKKVVGLEGYGLEMVEQVPIRTEANPHNEKYLETKKTKLGHLL